MIKAALHIYTFYWHHEYVVTEAASELFESCKANVSKLSLGQLALKGQVSDGRRTHIQPMSAKKTFCQSYKLFLGSYNSSMYS